MILFLFLTSFAFGQELPPKVLYHVGQKPYLLANDKAGNIPPEVWDKSIMGTDTRYGLVPYRRGLYGGSNFDNLELYGNLYFGEPKTPWVMKITLKEECRTAKSSAAGLKDPRYVNWVLAHIDELMRTTEECLSRYAENDDCSTLLSVGDPVAYGKPEDRCAQIQSRYLADIGAKVVKDDSWAESWYIRDRSCIEKIEASPKIVLQTLAQANWDFESRVRTYSGVNTGVYGGTLLALLWGALGDDPSVSQKTLDEILAKAKSSDIVASFLRETPEGQDYWVRESIPRLIGAFKTCQKRGLHSRFQEAGTAFFAFTQGEGGGKSKAFLETAKATISEAEKRCAAP